ncbi:unnamed protein product [Ophioblennius macclurei]
MKMQSISVNFRRKRIKSSLVLLLSVCVLLLLYVRCSYVSWSSPSLVPGLKVFPSYDVNCSAIYEMDPMEVGKSLHLRKNVVVEYTDESLAKATSNCPLFLKVRGYDKTCHSEEEEHFPLAFSMVVHKYAWSVERLLRVLYAPHNIYCIHYDQKSSPQFISAIEGLARCLPNVFIASKIESVYYASFSRLKADLNCLSDLLSSEVKWKYVINLCGQDFPLRSNIELVSELSKLNGTNMVETCRPTDVKRQRFTYHHKLHDTNNEFKKFPAKTGQLKTPPPHDIEMFTGNAYFVLSREFVQYMNSSNVVKDFIAWSEDTYSPDEHLWATLVRLPGVPGEVPRSQPNIFARMSKTRLVKWEYLEGSQYPRCSGKHVRSVCIYGAAELRWLLNDGHWFANKVDPKVDPVLIQCLEEKLKEKQNVFLSLTRKVCHEIS